MAESVSEALHKESERLLARLNQSDPLPIFVVSESQLYLLPTCDDWQTVYHQLQQNSDIGNATPHDL
jgi:hypothetical protein